MTITVQIPTALRRLTEGKAKISCAAANLGELFTALDQQFPELKPHLRDEAGEIRRFLNVYVNEEDVRFLGGASYRFQDGDEVLLVPSIAGGAPEEDDGARHHLQFPVSDPSAIGAIASVLQRNGIGVAWAAAIWDKNGSAEHQVQVLTEDCSQERIEAARREIDGLALDGKVSTPWRRVRE